MKQYHPPKNSTAISYSHPTIAISQYLTVALKMRELTWEAQYFLMLEQSYKLTQTLDFTTIKHKNLAVISMPQTMATFRFQIPFSHIQKHY